MKPSEDPNLYPCHRKQCCCKCASQVKIRKHPWNKQAFAKGSISDHIAYGCALDCFNKGENRVILMEDKHGECECWILK